MSATGLDPDIVRDSTRRAINDLAARLDEFDRLMAHGGIEAVVEALKKEQAKQGL